MTSSDLMLLETVDNTIVSEVLPDNAMLDCLEASVYPFQYRVIIVPDSTSDLNVVIDRGILGDEPTLDDMKLQFVSQGEGWPVSSEFSGWASDDCIEFCNSHGRIDDLRKCRRALIDIFSNVKMSMAELDYYQEIDVDDEGHVVIRLEIESDRKTYRKEYSSWVSWMVDELSDESRMIISVSINRL